MMNTGKWLIPILFVILVAVFIGIGALFKSEENKEQNIFYAVFLAEAQKAVKRGVPVDRIADEARREVLKNSQQFSAQELDKWGFEARARRVGEHIELAVTLNGSENPREVVISRDGAIVSRT